MAPPPTCYVKKVNEAYAGLSDEAREALISNLAGRIKTSITASWYA